MYETMLNDVKEKMKPVVDMAEINKKTAERLIALQTAYFNDFVSSSFAQMNALATVRDPRQATEMQVSFFKQMEGKLTDTAEQELAALTEAKEEYTALVEKSLSDMAEGNPYFKQMSGFMDELNATSVKVEPVVKEEVKKAPARRKTAA